MVNQWFTESATEKRRAKSAGIRHENCKKKMVYMSRSYAKKRAKDIARRKNRSLGVYRCEICHCYHLTTKKTVS